MADSTTLPSRINGVADGAAVAPAAPSAAPDVGAELGLLRRVLEAVPADAGAFTPGGDARSVAALVRHLDEVLGLTHQILTRAGVDLDAMDRRRGLDEEAFEAVRAGVAAHCSEVAAAAEEVTEGALDRPWRVLRSGQELGLYERRDALRRLGINHLIHHRGQLVLYLRLLGVPFEGAYADAPTAYVGVPSVEGGGAVEA